MGELLQPETDKMPAKPKGLGVRHMQGAALFCAMSIAYAMRVNMSMAIVAMTDPGGHGIFDWSTQVRGVILSSFFWGYILLQIPSGVLCAKFGGKVLLLVAVGVNALVTFAIPLGAQYGGWQLLCACRALQGLSQAAVFPAIHYLLGKWAPLEEKGRMSAFIYGGTNIGTALQMIFSGYVASAWGWQAIFYTDAALATLWVAVYWWIGSNSPQESNIISAEERAYIQTSLGHVGGHAKHPTPWRSMCTSLPFWALVVAHCGQNWGYWTLIIELPSFVKEVLGVDIQGTGTWTALPYIAMYAASFPMGYVADLVVRRRWLTVTAVRKVSNSIALWGPALALVGLTFAPAGNLAVSVLLITVTVALNAGLLLENNVLFAYGMLNIGV